MGCNDLIFPTGINYSAQFLIWKVIKSLILNRLRGLYMNKGIWSPIHPKKRFNLIKLKNKYFSWIFYNKRYTVLILKGD